MRAKRYTITGRVQGVFFRAETQRKARELGVAGWVRNCADGSVEVHAEGSPQQLKALETWLRTGPADAEVADVRACDEELAGFGAFAIQQ